VKDALLPSFTKQKQVPSAMFLISLPINLCFFLCGVLKGAQGYLAIFLSLLQKIRIPIFQKEVYFIENLGIFTR
jgi:hypothetical protein